MKQLAVIVCAAVIGMAAVPPGIAEPQPVSNQAGMDAVFRKLGTSFVKAERADSLSIAVVKDGRTSFYNFGNASRETRQAPTENTAYEIASITKVFTSLILAHAVVEGKIDPTADIRNYLPGPYPQLAFEGTPITVQQLANTTSALPDNLPDFSKLTAGLPPDKVPAKIAAALKGYTPARLLGDLATVRPTGRPGIQPRHSNLAAELLGIILERVYGDSYANLLARYVEKPFGMSRGTDAHDATMATGYDERHAVMPPLRGPAITSAGGLRYTPADMARFLSAEIATANPAIALSQKPTWGDPNAYAIGYNWIQDRTIDGARHLRASGGAFGFSSYIEMYPDKGYGIVLFANRAGSVQDDLQQLADAALKELFGTPAVLTALHDALEKDDYRHVDATVADVRRAHPELNLTEAFVNRWGYALLADKRSEQAIALFTYNTRQWPTSWNAFDSLAEACENTGDSRNAIVNYRRSLAMNAANQHAADHLRKLEAASR